MDIPQFFSLCLDQAVVYVNVHWLSYNADNMTISFHMVRIESYFLDRSKSLKKVHQIVQNILDYALRERLTRIREALDKYYQTSILERVTAIHRRNSESQGEEQPIPPRQLDDPSVDQRSARRRKLGRPARRTASEQTSQKSDNEEDNSVGSAEREGPRSRFVEDSRLGSKPSPGAGSLRLLACSTVEAGVLRWSFARGSCL